MDPHLSPLKNNEALEFIASVAIKIPLQEKDIIEAMNGALKSAIITKTCRTRILRVLEADCNARLGRKKHPRFEKKSELKFDGINPEIIP